MAKGQHEVRSITALQNDRLIVVGEEGVVGIEVRSPLYVDIHYADGTGFLRVPWHNIAAIDYIPKE